MITVNGVPVSAKPTPSGPPPDRRPPGRPPGPVAPPPPPTDPPPPKVLSWRSDGMPHMADVVIRVHYGLRVYTGGRP